MYFIITNNTQAVINYAHTMSRGLPSENNVGKSNINCKMRSCVFWENGA